MSVCVRVVVAALLLVGIELGAGLVVERYQDFDPERFGSVSLVVLP